MELKEFLEEKVPKLKILPKSFSLTGQIFVNLGEEDFGNHFAPSKAKLAYEFLRQGDHFNLDFFRLGYDKLTSRS